MSLSDVGLIYDSVTGCFNKKGCKINLFQDLNFTSFFIFTIIDNFKLRYRMDTDFTLSKNTILHTITFISFILKAYHEQQIELLKISHNTLFPPSYLKKG